MTHELREGVSEEDAEHYAALMVFVDRAARSINRNTRADEFGIDVGVLNGFMVGVRLAQRYPDVARRLVQLVELAGPIANSGVPADMGERVEELNMAIVDEIGGPR